MLLLVFSGRTARRIKLDDTVIVELGRYMYMYVALCHILTILVYSNNQWIAGEILKNYKSSNVKQYLKLVSSRMREGMCAASILLTFEGQLSMKDMKSTNQSLGNSCEPGNSFLSMIGQFAISPFPSLTTDNTKVR